MRPDSSFGDGAEDVPTSQGPAVPVAADDPPAASPGGVETATEVPAPDQGRAKKPKKDKGPLSFLRELPVLLLVAFLLALLIKTFLVQAFYIPSASMENTLLIGDRVLVNKVVYHLHPPRRGDIIVFGDPHPTPSEH